MPLPGAWTEPSLIAAMEAELEPVTAELGLSALDVLSTAATDVAVVLGVSDVADVTYTAAADVVKVLLIAKWIAWQKAYDVAITKYNTGLSGGKKFDLGSVFDHIAARLAMAQTAASVYPEVAGALNGSGATAAVSSVSTASSPYNPIPIVSW